jgi:Flp pilus assembly protein TadG
MRRWLRDEGAASATEFALVLPLFIGLTLGLINLCIALFAFVNLLAVTQAAARCAAIDTTNCSTSTAVNTWAQARYAGPGIGATFALTSQSCGKQVDSTGTFHLVTVVYNPTLTISATACYPT